MIAHSGMVRITGPKSGVGTVKAATPTISNTARLRAGDPDHAAVGDHPVALLAGGGRAPAGLLAAAGDRNRPASTHHLCGPHPGRIARAVHVCEPACALRAELL